MSRERYVDRIRKSILRGVNPNTINPYKTNNAFNPIGLKGKRKNYKPNPEDDAQAEKRKLFRQNTRTMAPVTLPRVELKEPKE